MIKLYRTISKIKSYCSYIQLASIGCDNCLFESICKRCFSFADIVDVNDRTKVPYRGNKEDLLDFMWRASSLCDRNDCFYCIVSGIHYNRTKISGWKINVIFYILTRKYKLKLFTLR